MIGVYPSRLLLDTTTLKYGDATLSRVLRLPHLLFVDLPSADLYVPRHRLVQELTGTPIALC